MVTFIVLIRETESIRMKIVALMGSPRKQGNTDIMADEVLRGAEESTFFIYPLNL